MLRDVEDVAAGVTAIVGHERNFIETIEQPWRIVLADRTRAERHRWRLPFPHPLPRDTEVYSMERRTNDMPPRQRHPRLGMLVQRL